MQLREYLKENRILADGAFGTYFSHKTGLEILPETANVTFPELVREIHKDYIKAGARLIRTNTFASNRENLHCDKEKQIQNLEAAVRIVKEAIEEYKEEGKADQIFIAGDIGPISHHRADLEDDVKAEYLLMAKQFIKQGVDAIVFETFADCELILDVIKDIRAISDVFIWVQFSVNQLGYSGAGMSAKSLFAEACQLNEIDAVGLNCGVGPGHMAGLVKQLANSTNEKYLSAFPNAGYPKIIRDKVVFVENIDYFVDKVSEVVSYNARIIGGCCGTNPEYIRALNAIKVVDDTNTSFHQTHVEVKRVDEKKAEPVYHANGQQDFGRKSNTALDAFWKKKETKEKLIAVELSPPMSADDEKLLQTAKDLERFKVDVVTFPDSPSGRTRADSILMAAKVARHTDLCVMPHICCRDKNAIAMRSQLLGAHLSDIRNLLIITGDPIPTMARNDIKSVFNFDSVGLMKIVREMNKEQFESSKLFYGGAINQNRINLASETKRIVKKMDAGAQFFFTQPIFTEKEANALRKMKQETGARILCGIMPLISMKNALFIKNEMVGMNVTDEIIKRYEGAITRQDGEKCAVSLAKDIMKLTEDFADGYYFSIPFNRGYLLEDIL